MTFVPGKTLVHYAGRVYDDLEKSYANKAVEEFQLTYGRFSKEFETKFSKFIGVPNTVLVNSGSSANLVAVSTLTSPKLKDRQLKPGNEVITVAAGFPTTLAPIIQNQLVPVFVDVNIGTYNAIPDQVDMAIGPRTKAIFLPHTLGVPFDRNALEYLAKRHNLWVIGDCCFTGSTLIPTKDGTKRICDVIPGDRLLGFNGTSFQETIVEKTGNRIVPREQLLKITLKECKKPIYCTRDHKFLVKGEWVPAEDLKEGDELMHCTWSDYTSWRRDYKLTDVGRRSISDRMKYNNPSFDPEVVKKSSSNRKHGKSHIERQVLKTIVEHNLPIRYVGDKSFWIGDRTTGFKNPDFIFEEKNIVFEVFDPTCLYSKGKRGDIWKEEREKFYTSFGYKTVFIPLSHWVNYEQRQEIAKLLRTAISNGKQIAKISKISKYAHNLNIYEEPDGFIRVYDIKCGPHSNFCLMSGSVLAHNCDALGSEYDGKKVGSFEDIGTFSFYPAHHITMGQGGAVVSKNDDLAKIARSFVQWGRDCSCPPATSNVCGRRFTQSYADLPFGFDHKYVYSHIGYNFEITDIQAAIGCAQLEKLDEFIAKRRFNHQYLLENLDFLSDWLIFQKRPEFTDPSWFCFVITVKDDAPFTRNQLTSFLEENKIETRPLFAGNLLKHPAFRDIKYEKVSCLPNTDRIMNNTFFIGVYPGIGVEEREWIVDTFRRVKYAYSTRTGK